MHIKGKFTSFATQVFNAVRQIPRGQTKSYKEVAVTIGHPNAYRAVANVLAGNTDKSVPCHRVIKSDGKRLLRNAVLCPRCYAIFGLRKAREKDNMSIHRLFQATQRKAKMAATRRDMANFGSAIVTPHRCTNALTDSLRRGTSKISLYRVKEAVFRRSLGGYNGLRGEKARLLKREHAI